MKIRVQISSFFVVETEGGDTEDPGSQESHCKMVEKMTPDEIRKTGVLEVELVDGNAEVVGPDDEE